MSPNIFSLLFASLDFPYSQRSNDLFLNPSVAVQVSSLTLNCFLVSFKKLHASSTMMKRMPELELASGVLQHPLFMSQS